jgi:hypothetical protein
MARTTDVIRLVGGPPKLDGALYDLRLSEHDRADAADDQFVRATDGSTITALTSLQAQCRDHRQASELATKWRVLLYRSSGVRRRVRVYRFQGHYSIEPRRDERGRWTVGVCARLTGPGFPPPPARSTVWSALEHAVDEAATRFTEVAALVPAGPLADRAAGTRDAVESCVADARRLCAVGATFAPEARHGGLDDQAATLLARITSLVRTIDLATSHLVALHLEVHDAVDPVEPIATLTESWAELQPPRYELDGDAVGPLVSLPEPE